MYKIDQNDLEKRTLHNFSEWQGRITTTGVVGIAWPVFSHIRSGPED